MNSPFHVSSKYADCFYFQIKMSETQDFNVFAGADTGVFKGNVFKLRIISVIRIFLVLY